MSNGMIKFQVFLGTDEAIKIKELTDRFSNSGLAGSISETIRFLVLKGLNSSQNELVL